MKTIIRKDSGASLYLLGDATPVLVAANNITVGDTDSPDYIIADLNDGNAHVVEGVTPPEDWSGDKYRLQDGEWFDMTPEREAARIAVLKEVIVQTTQRRLDDFARTRNYDNMLSACTYSTSTVHKFQSEGQYCVDARDATWAKLYEILAEVEAGTRPVPSGYSDIEPDLPVLTWPT